mmetsp:Transcript_38686/g.90928  ORF Transcript_38686/g.90928 Transcript_38686/m.90928 type:complete len:598 (+) Transcript_38686:100-1893(+)
MEGVENAGVTLQSSLDKVEQFRRGLKKLSAVLQNSGQEIQEVFGDATLLHSGESDEITRELAEFLVAWREVGEATVSLGAQAEALCGSLDEAAMRGTLEKTQRLQEAEKLQTNLETVAKAAPSKSGGGLLGFFRSAPLDPEAEAAAQARLEGLKASNDASFTLLKQEIDKASERLTSDLKKFLGDARRHSKALGEKLITLRPSWRGSSTRLSGTSPATAATPSSGSKVGKGKNVENLIRSLSSVEGRQQASAAKDAESTPAEMVTKEAPLTAPPAENLGAGEWRISGIYEHQCLKAGLRVLEEKWPSEAIDELPRKKDGSSALFRESLVRDLLSAKIRVQSVLGNDIAAAQRDLVHLNLRQLLRLRVHHLDYVPSGCGADTVHAVGATQEAFMSALDSLLFKMLGRKALEGVPDKAGLDEHKAGREAVQLASAAAAVPAPEWWCWWITDTKRVYLDAHTFTSRPTFPEGPEASVLEIVDNSKKDHHDPSGRLRWMDWKILVIKQESGLTPYPRRAEGVAEKTSSSRTPSKEGKAGSPGVVGGETPKGGGGALEGQEESAASASAGAATASMVSPNVLQDMRKSLRKTGTLDDVARKL